MYVDDTGLNTRARKREHINAVMTFNAEKLALSQHVIDFDRRID